MKNAKKRIEKMKIWQKICIGLCLIVLLTAGIEIGYNYKVLRLPAEERGIKEITEDRVEFSGYDKNGEQYCFTGGDSYIKINVDGKYVDKFVYSYDFRGLLDMQVTIQYQNGFGQPETKCIADNNSAVISKSVMNIRKKVDWIELRVCNLQPVKENAEDGSSVLKINDFYIKNESHVNPVRILVVFLMGCLVLVLAVFREFFGRKVEYAFLLISVTMGVMILSCFPATKVGWDEETHFQRSYRMSLFPSGQEVPEEYHQFLVAGIDTWPLNLPASIEERQELEAFFAEACAGGDRNIVIQRGLAGIYSSGYVASAVFLKAGRFLHMSFPVLYQFGRLGNLLLYCCIMFFTIRILPIGKRIMTAVGLMPTSMFMACCYSYDPSVIAFTALGLALIFQEMEEKDKAFSWKKHLLALGCLIWGILPKAVYAPVVLIGLMIPVSKYDSKKQKWLAWLSVAVVFAGLMSTFVLPSLLSPSSYGDTRGGDVNVVLQMKNVFSNPVAYAGILFKNIWNSLPSYLCGQAIFQFMGHWGTAGFGTVTLVYVVLVILAEKKKEEGFVLSGKQKIGCLFFSACSVILIWTAFYLTFTPVGSSNIGGVQGRYFLPLLLPVFLSFNCSKVRICITEKAKNLWVAGISAGLLVCMIWTQIPF